MLFRYALKELTRRRSRSLLAVISVALSMMLLIGIWSISRSVNAAVTEPLAVSGSDLVVQKRVKPCPFALVKRPKDLGSIPQSVVDKIRDIHGVMDALGVLELWAFTPEAGKGANAHPTVVTGIPPGLPRLGPIRPIKEGKNCCILKEGDYFKAGETHSALAEISYAKVANLKVGDRLQLATEEFTLAGIVDAKAKARIAAGQVYIPLRTSQEMLRRYFPDEGPVVDTVFVRLESFADRDKVKGAIQELIGPGCHITESTSLTRDVAGLSLLTGSVTKTLSMLALVLTVLLILRTGWAVVSERRREIGVLKTIGWRTSDVVRLLAVEILLENLVGAGIGAALGLALGAGYARNANLTLPTALNSYPACASTPAPLTLHLPPPPVLPFIGAALGIALVVGVVAALLAGRRAARLDPAVALRTL